MTAPPGAARLPRQAVLLLIGLTFAWGTMWPMMKLAVGEIPIFTFRAMCAVLGGLALLALARAGRVPLAVPRAEWWPLVLASLFNVFGWFTLSATGVTLIASGRAALIAYTMPLWTFLLGLVFLDERPSWGRWLGLALGLTGVAILAGDDIGALGRAPLGAIAMVGAAMSWAAGTVVLKRTAWSIPLTALIAWQLVIAGVPLIAAAVVLDLDQLGPVSAGALGALAYTVVIGIIFGMSAWIRIVHLVPANVASLGAIMVPFVGVLSGALMLGEPVGWQEISALGLIVAAMTTVLPLPRPAALFGSRG